MSNTLYVTHFPPILDEEAVRALFDEYGTVESVSFGTNERFDVPYALVTMSAEKEATQANHSLNGREIDGMRLAVSYPDLGAARPLMSKQRKLAGKVAQSLDETEKIPCRQIETMIRLCGSSFVTALAEETERVEAEGGLMTADESRRRTKGGVFFYLARPRVADPVYRVIFNRKGKMPQPQEEG